MTPQQINVLIACEESQVEVKAFRSLGCKAFSCDIQTAHGGHPEWHIVGDALPLLAGTTKFTTQDGKRHHLTRWHLIIAHPPCTFLCKVSTSAHKRGDTWLPGCYTQLIQGREFFYSCLNACAPYVAVENPIPHREAWLPKPDFYTCPSQFGHKYTKKTLWWVKNLTPVMPTIIYPNAKCFVTASRGKYRSRTFANVAQACANTWIAQILRDHAAEKRRYSSSAVGFPIQTT